MNIEIEVADEEIRDAIMKNVKVAVAYQLNNWSVESYVQNQIKERLKPTIDALISESLNDSKTLREKVSAEIERKLRAQLAVVLKNAGA